MTAIKILTKSIFKNTYKIDDVQLDKLIKGLKSDGYCVITTDEGHIGFDDKKITTQLIRKYLFRKWIEETSGFECPKCKLAWMRRNEEKSGYKCNKCGEYMSNNVAYKHLRSR